jgi:hypothetical protein
VYPGELFDGAKLVSFNSAPTFTIPATPELTTILAGIAAFDLASGFLLSNR